MQRATDIITEILIGAAELSITRVKRKLRPPMPWWNRECDEAKRGPEREVR